MAKEVGAFSGQFFGNSGPGSQNNIPNNLLNTWPVSLLKRAFTIIRIKDERYLDQQSFAKTNGFQNE